MLWASQLYHQCAVLIKYHSSNIAVLNWAAFLVHIMTVLDKYKYYRNLGVEPFEAILWAGESGLFVSPLLSEL